jgi:ADP-heptose:LPS heptosyltransferase
VRFVDGVRKIAVLRANGIGDYIFAIPALEALHNTYRNAEIVLLALPWHQEFLEGGPGHVDRVIVVPFSRGIRDSRPSKDGAALEVFFQKMADERFDIALQMHGGGRFSNPFVRRLGARLTAGCRTPDAVPLDRWLPYVYYQSEVIRNLEVAFTRRRTTHELPAYSPHPGK